MQLLAFSPLLACFLCRWSTQERIFHKRDHSDIKQAPHQVPTINTEQSAQKFLTKYGWMGSVHWEDSQQPDPAHEDPVPPDMSSPIQEDIEVSDQTEGPANQKVESPAFQQALKAFQGTTGLAVTGIFDPATREAMNSPRCGVPDQGWHPGVLSPQATMEDKGKRAALDHGLVRTKRFSHHLLLHRLKARGRRREVADGNVSGLVFRKRSLKWRLLREGYSSQLTVLEQRAAIHLAFRLWSEVTPIDFEEDLSSPVSLLDITLAFGTGRHLGCSQAFDGGGQEVAHSWQNRAVHFDDDEHFTAANSNQGISLLRTQQRLFILTAGVRNCTHNANLSKVKGHNPLEEDWARKVAVHEVGHVLGLPHMYGRGSMMQPNYSTEGRDTELAWSDRKAIQQLYGVCEGPFDTVFDWVRRERGEDGRLVLGFNTYFFRGTWYWMYENRNNRTRYGDPLPIYSGWHGIPTARIDAFVHVCTWSKDAAYFFKGTRYWRYDNFNDRAYTEDSQGVRYPKLISSGFPGISGPINAAFFDRRDQCIYFFKQHQVTAFNVNTNMRVPGYPRRITDVFPALFPGDHPVSNLDAVYYSDTHRATFLFKGLYFWRVVNRHDRLSNPHLPYNGLQAKRKVSEQWLDICNVHPSAMA